MSKMKRGCTLRRFESSQEFFQNSFPITELISKSRLAGTREINRLYEERLQSMCTLPEEFQKLVGKWIVR